ncbi:MAG: hypothetical protein EA384_05045 [Spirochaetaceae bacterium]|nr:MAG: hypothetical protein EA384_05045 [Spirochaetaceae bacterium]
MRVRSGLHEPGHDPLRMHFFGVVDDPEIAAQQAGSILEQSDASEAMCRPSASNAIEPKTVYRN